MNVDLSWVFVPEGTDKKMFYMACPKTKRKVMDTGNGMSHCESCMKSYNNADCVPTYNFSIRVSDCSGTLIVSCFGDIGDAILGKTASEFH